MGSFQSRQSVEPVRSWLKNSTQLTNAVPGNHDDQILGARIAEAAVAQCGPSLPTNSETFATRTALRKK
jgi:hypothetical protein